MFLFYLVCWKHCESQDWSWPGFLWHTIWWRSLFPLLELLTVHSHSSVCDLSRPMLLHQQPVLVPQQPYFVTEWPTQLFSHCLWILTVSFLLLWKNNNCWQLVQHLTAYTISYPFIHTYVHIRVHKIEIILWSFSTEVCLYAKNIWNMCGNAWLALDWISPMTVGVNYHMIFLPPSLDGVNFLLKDFLSFKE